MPGSERPAPERAATMQESIRRYLEEAFLIEFGDEITAETDLFEAQIVDSFGFVELVSYLESTFAIQITDDDLLSNRLTTLGKILELVEERVGASSHG